VYSILNPLVPVIDGFRRCVLNGKPPQWPELAAGAISAFVALIGGFALFKRLETGMADIA
jgi:ABC-2 type transport system permease protein/lipopolysaccharide transport system permease protein